MDDPCNSQTLGQQPESRANSRAPSHEACSTGAATNEPRRGSRCLSPGSDQSENLHLERLGKIVASEVQQFKDLLDAFAMGQRERTDGHLRQLEHLLSSMIDRLQSPPRDDEAHPATPAAVAPAVTFTSTLQTQDLQNRRRSFLHSWRSTSNNNVHNVPSASTSKLDNHHPLTARQEYIQLKTAKTSSRTTLALDQLTTTCGCGGARLRYYLPIPNFRSIVHGTVFGNCCVAIIILNVVFSIILADSEMRMYIKRVNGQPGSLPDWFTIVDLVFLSLFGLELLFRVVADEMFFFIGQHWKWNWFDFIILMVAAVDSLSFISGPNISFVRVVRLLRVVRSIKVIRILRHFVELRVMLLQIVNSLKPMIWAFIFLGLVILMFSLVFTQGIISYFDDLAAGRIVLAQGETAETTELVTLCGSFIMSILALFMSISGGISWWEIVKPLTQVSSIYVAMFTMYILVLMIGVLNIIVGIFVDSATDAAVKDREALAHEALQKNLSTMKGLEEIFEELDQDKIGTLSWQRFEEVTNRSEVRALFASLGLDVSHAKEVFKLIDLDGNGRIGLDEFVVGIMHSKGEAQRTDIQSLMCEVSRMMKSFQRYQHWSAKHFNRIESCLNREAGLTTVSV